MIRLKGNDYHYLVRVRRLAVGEFFSALLPGGEETLVQVLSADSGILTGKCLSSSPDHPHIPSSSITPLCKNSSEKIPPIILFQALPKGEKMDLIVRQAAEGSITEIVPFVSEFTFGKINTGQQKFSRWERIIKEARQQSGSRIATELHQPLTMIELFDYWKKYKESGALGLLFHHLDNNSDSYSLEAGSSKYQSRGLEQKSLHGYLNNNPKFVVLVIGPEGGFSENELKLFIENDFKTLTIGDTVLRTETAALYFAAAIRIILLERDSWE